MAKKSEQNWVIWIAVGVAVFLPLLTINLPQLANNQYYTAVATSVVSYRIHWNGDQDKPSPTIWISATPASRPPDRFERQIVVSDGDFNRISRVIASATRCSGASYGILVLTTIDAANTGKSCNMAPREGCKLLNGLLSLAKSRGLHDLSAPTEYLQRFMACA